MAEDPYGLDRVVGEPGVLPQRAQRLDPALPIRPDEMLIDVESLNVDAASFKQIKESCGGQPEAVVARIQEIVRERGKLQNPVTGSGGMLLGRATYEPGWRWSEHVGAKTGARLCEVEHVCFVVSGKSGLRMRDGSEKVLSAGDVFAVPAGHDSWVIGSEPYISLHLMGASDYGAQHRGT